MFELIAAPHTPFDSSGALDLGPVARQAEHLRATGVHGVLVAGSTGEGFSLTSGERKALAGRWVEVAQGLEVIIQVGHTAPREARELAHHASQIRADAICAAPPSWFAIRETEELVATCAEIAGAAADLPFLYYHIPALSGVNLPMAPFVEQARKEIPGFAGVKYTHTDPDDFRSCVREHGDAVKLLWGCDELLLTGLDLGAHGAIGSTYNFAAPLATALVQAHAEGDTSAARDLQSRIARLVETLDRSGYAAAAKSVMGLLGIDCGPVRLPLRNLDERSVKTVRGDLEQLGFFGWIQSPGSR